MLNLLKDKMIRAQTNAGIIETLTLPETYEALYKDRIAGFHALRMHQQHAWHALLAQLGALACARAKESKPPRKAGDWERLLRNLANYEEDHCWQLVNENQQFPAFLQPPIGGNANQYTKQHTTPDGIDILISTKNHDLKKEATRNAQPDDWLFALVTVQTASGYMGKKRYGVTRMNAGFGSRICVGLRPAEGGIGRHIQHDVAMMLEDELEREYPREPDFRRIDLEWLEPWDGNEQLGMDGRSPYRIETCRRLRLWNLDEVVHAWQAGAARRRTDDGNAKGNVGDFWTPIKADKNESLTMSKEGFRYDRLMEILGTGYRPWPAMRIPDENAKWRLVARGLCRGKGQTNGYHQRNDIVLSGHTAKALGTQEGRQELHEAASALLKHCRQMVAALRAAIATHQNGGRQTKDTDKKLRASTEPALHELRDWIDDRFFCTLEEHHGAADEADRATVIEHFSEALRAEASAILTWNLDRMGGARNRRHTARAKAEATFLRRSTVRNEAPDGQGEGKDEGAR